jgi:hypothetical protein
MVKPRFSVFFVYNGQSLPLIVSGVKAWPLEKALEHAKRVAEVFNLQTKIEPCE